MVPGFLLALPAGALVDRWNRKRTMILCDSGRTLALGSVALALTLGHLTVLLLTVMVLVESSLAVFFGLAESAAVPRVVPMKQLAEAVSINQASGEAAGLIGPSLSGLLYSLGQVLPFLVDAVSYGISVFSLVFIKTEFQEERSPAGRNLRVEVLEGIRWAWSQPFIRVSAFLIAGLNFLAAATTLTLIVLAKHLHASPAAIGLIFALFSAGGLLGSITAGWLRRRLGFTDILIGMMWGFAILWPLYALASKPF
ncbi:MAG: MFS transporter, partial [Chloroflexi bacterium]